MDNNVFNPSKQPRNSLELLKWVIFELVLLENYSKTLDKKQGVIEFLKAYFWIALISLTIYIIESFLIALLNLPCQYPYLFQEELLNVWIEEDGFVLQNFFTYFFENSELGEVEWLLEYFSWMLIILFIVGLFDFSYGFVMSLIILIEFGVIILFPTTESMMLAFITILMEMNYEFSYYVVGLVLKSTIFTFMITLLINAVLLSNRLIFHPPIKLTRLTFFLAINLIILGIISLLAIDAREGETVNLIFFEMEEKDRFNLILTLTLLPFCFVFFVLRLIFYPYYVIKSFFYNKLDNNVYLKDGLIYFPIWGLENKLYRDAHQRPEAATKFFIFLRKYRPLQQELEANVLHICISDLLNQYPLVSEIIVDNPYFTEEQREKYRPSDSWLKLLEKIKEDLRASKNQNNVWLQQQKFIDTVKGLKQLREQTFCESSYWNFYYFSALDKWIERAEEIVVLLTQKAQQIEPLAKNCYILEIPLIPNQNTDVFMGRQAAKDRLAQEILTNKQMPLFLLQGQRRIGKTSLLKFLEVLLPSGFKVAFQDCQSSSVNDDNPEKIIHKWFHDLYNKINHKLNISAETWETKESWSESWQILEQHLLEIVKNNPFKIILAFDEYETLHKGLKSNPDKADVLLGAMRSFLQHQNKVAFLFTGAAFLDELTQPAWSSYFPQRVLLDIDYLSFDESKQLIILPKSLQYPDEIIEKMFFLTQGHPALLQALCKAMVDIANAQNKPLFSIKDLEEATQQVIEQYSGATEVFWNQFCETEDYREIVRKIIENQPLDSSNQIIKRLFKHRYIIKADQTYRFRVPLFEMWLKERF